ncbi:MAG: acetylornithine transaminase [Leptospiraceae bacterium]|nr:acetylornithine transaminase [Leptospiraceae bacterium]MCP5503137.1 acetylornithine transaminase [Leptospiraceae bacterium]
MTGMKSELDEIKDKTEQYILGNYKRYDLAFEYGVGELLFDTENRQYIDFFCGISVTNLGHGEADIIDALRTQADKLFHTSNLFYSRSTALLAEALVVNSFPSKVFFCNSGTEANEAAFKLARKYGVEKGIERPVVLSLKNGFHGRSFGSMSITGQEKIHKGFGELASGVDYVQPNDETDLHQKFQKYKGRVAAFFMEPIIGEGGIIPIEREFAEVVRNLCKEAGALLVFDEIQTGMGRTGKLFAYEHYGFTPDIMTLAKGLGSGFPIGAVLIADSYAGILGPGAHGSTFGGNPLAAAVAYETLKVILSRDVLKHTAAISDYMFTHLNIMKSKYSIIREVRGVGLHIGLDLSIPSGPVVEDCMKNGLLLNSTANTVIRIMPPLNVSLERVNEALGILEDSISRFQNK